MPAGSSARCRSCSGGTGRSPSSASWRSRPPSTRPRDYAGGPALLPGPLALLALGYTAPRRVGWIGAAGYVVVAVVVRLARRRRRPRRAVDPRRLGFGRRARRSGDRRPRGTGGSRAGARRPRTLRSRRSPTNGCASPRTCTTPSPTRWRRSTSSPASPPTCSTATRPGQAGAGGDPRRQQRCPRRARRRSCRCCGTSGGDGAARRRSPTLGRLDDLVERARPTACRSTVDVHGDVGGVGAVRQRRGVPGRAGGADQRPPPRRRQGRASGSRHRRRATVERCPSASATTAAVGSRRRRRDADAGGGLRFGRDARTCRVDGRDARRQDPSRRAASRSSPTW